MGAWERSVSIYRTAVTWVVEANAALPDALAGTIWWGPADSAKTVFVPMLVAAGEPPGPYTVGNPAALDRSSAYWAHRYVQNLCQLRYERMIVPVKEASARWESLATSLMASIRKGPKLAAADLKTKLDAHAEAVLAGTWRLADDLMVSYADGGFTASTPNGAPQSEQIGYPAPWLKAVGFDSGPNIRLGTLPCPDCEEDGSGKPLNALLASASSELPALATTAGDSAGSAMSGVKAMRSRAKPLAVTPQSAAGSAAGSVAGSVVGSAAGSASVVASVSALMAVSALIVAAMLPMFQHARRSLGRSESFLAANDGIWPVVARVHAPIEDERSYNAFPASVAP